MSTHKTDLTQRLEALKDGIVTPIVFDPTQNLFSGGVYDQNGSLCQAAERSQLITSSRIANPSHIDPRLECAETIGGNSLYLGHYSQKYGRFLLETLARFWPLLSAHNYDHFIFHAEPGEYQIDPKFSPAKTCFDCFGIEFSQVHIVQKPVRVTNLTVPSKLISKTNQPHAGQASVYQKISAFCQQQSHANSETSAKRIYLSRKNLMFAGRPDRMAVNEAMVEALFQEFGFTVIYPEEHNFAEQIQMLQTAEAIAGICGAALHNSLFMQPNATEISIGIPAQPNGPNFSQITCNRLSQVRSVFIPFKGGFINYNDGAFVYYIPHLRKRLQAWLQGSQEHSGITPPRVENRSLESLVAIVGIDTRGMNILAMALEQAGLFCGDITRPNTHARSSNWGNEPLEELNSAILRANNAAWDNPPQNAIEWHDAHTLSREHYLGELARQSRVLMFKDAQTLLNLPFWQDGASRLNLIGVFSHPMNIAVTLYQKNKTPLRSGFALGSHYNRLLLDAYENSPFPLICADLQPADLLKQLKHVIKQVDNLLEDLATLSVEKGTAFYKPNRETYQFFEPCLTDGPNQTIDKLQIDAAKAVYEKLLNIENRPVHQQEKKVSVPLEDSPEAFKQAISKEPDSWFLHMMLADRYLTSGEHQFATDSYLKALEINPKHLETQIKLGEVLVKQGKTDDATEIFERIADSKNITIGLLIKLILLYRQQQNFERVIELCHQAFSLNPTHQTHHLTTLMADGHRHLGDLKAALKLYLQAVTLDPSKSYVYQALGDIYRQLKDFSSAVEMYQKAIEGLTTNIWVYINMGHVLNQLGRYNESRSILQLAAEFNQNEAGLYRVWGDSFRMEGNDLKAVQYYQKALTINSIDLGSLHSLGWTFIRLGKNEEAKKIILQAKKSYPENPNINHALETILAQTK